MLFPIDLIGALYPSTETGVSSHPFAYEANCFAADYLLEDEDVLEMLNADMSFFQAAAELKVPPELLDFKFRMMKRSGVQIVDSPITSNSDFLKDIPTSGIIENY